MDNKPSFLWALAVGLLFPVLQVLISLIRFGQPDPETPFTDYVWSFLAGVLIGAGLIYFLRRSENQSVFRAVLIAFVVSLPFALFGMVFGDVVGAIGILFLAVSPSLFIIALGYFIGRALAKR